MSNLENLQQDKIRKSNILLQHILDKFLSNLLEIRNRCFEKNINKEIEIKPMTTMEEKTLRFVSGYIPFSLKKKYKNMKESVSTKAVLTVINAWDANCDIAEEDSGLMEYTKEWVEKINRGGLFEVTDSFYLFAK